MGVIEFLEIACIDISLIENSLGAIAIIPRHCFHRFGGSIATI